MAFSFFFFSIFSRSRDIQVFAKKIDDVTNRLTMKINHKTRISLEILK